MILSLHTTLRAAVLETVARVYQLDPASLPAVVLETPPRRAFGDLATPIAFELARRLKKAPRAIAQEIVAATGPLPGFTRLVAAPNGYLNAFIDRPALLRAALEMPDGQTPDGQTSATTSAIPREKTILEHTAINPNKAAHIGHLRNSVLGDTLGRLLRFCRVPVEIQNYIDDTGVQVADVVVGFHELEGKTLADVRAIAESTRFDYYCWDLYARVTEWYEADKTRLKVRSETLHAIEHGGNDIAELAAFIANRIVRCHLKTMGRINVDYDLLTWEGDILRLKFWATAFDILRNSGAMFLQDTGKLKGCWVMRIEEDDAPAPPAAEAPGGSDAAAPDSPEADAEAGESGDGGEQREKVIVRSDGTVTYVGKDIAYQFWKFGLLGKDFHYRPFAQRLAGDTLWATTSDPDAEEGRTDRPAFGRAGVTYNVIDSRQSYLQKLLKQALRTLGHVRESERSNHFSYEMVVLTHRTARELGYEAADDGRPFVEVSGRKGLGVKADDLFDRMIDKAHVEVRKRNADEPEAVTRRTAEAIGVAAVRYFLVKFTRSKIIAFDMDEALSFEGESGPYLQYSVVRANNIFNKLRERDGITAADLAGKLTASAAAPLAEGDEGDELWNLVLESARLDEIVEQAVRTLEPSVIAKYAFALAQTFNGLYHKYPVLNEEREEWRFWRAAAIDLYRRQLTRALELMGADVPSRM